MDKYAYKKYSMKKILTENPYFYHDQDSNASDVFSTNLYKLLGSSFFFFNWDYNVPDNPYLDLFQYFSTKLLRKAQDRQARLVFNWEVEGYVPTKYFRILKHNCDKYKVPYDSIVYISSNLLDNEHCNKFFKNSHPRFKVISYLHFFVKARNANKTTYKKLDVADADLMWEHHINDFKNRYKKNNIVSSLSRINRIHRTFANYVLSKSSIKDYTMMSQNAITNEDKVELREKLFSTFGSTRDVLDTKIDEWSKTLPLTIDRNDFQLNWVHTANNKNTINAHISNSVLFQIINETSIDRNSIFFSEKTANSIAAFQPFIIYGNRHINQTMKKYGFELYDEIFDYSFDSIEDPFKRYAAIIDMIVPIVTSLSKKSFDNQINFRVSLKEKLIHNYNTMTNYDPTKSIL